MKMPYLNNSLMRDEKLVYAVRPHWVVFMPTIIAFILTFIFWAVAGDYFVFRSVIYGYFLYQWCAIAAFLVGVYWLIGALITFYTSEYGVTNRRVVMKTGWISRQVLEIFLHRLEAINVSQTVPGRILDYGTIVVIGTGGTRDYYPNIPHPLTYRHIVQKQMENVFNEGGNKSR